MKFDESNNFSYYRENHWDDPWPFGNGATSESGFRDYVVADYFPSLVWSNSFEYWIDFTKAPLPNRHYQHIIWPILGVYLVGVYGGQYLMRTRPAFDLKFPLAVWNLLLTVFSLAGALRTVPHLFVGTWNNGPLYFICRSMAQSYSDPAVYFWIVVFVWSKLGELLDTAFLVLRKKPVGFLHVYHHVTVTAYCWYSLGHQFNSGIWFASMNYTVHAIMYFYYFLAACTKPPRWGRHVTELQITQMFIGVIVNVAHYYYGSRITHCDISFSMAYSAFAMYASYVVLFTNFFVERHLQKKRQAKAGERDRPTTKNETAADLKKAQ